MEENKRKSRNYFLAIFAGLLSAPVCALIISHISVANMHEYQSLTLGVCMIAGFVPSFILDKYLGFVRGLLTACPAAVCYLIYRYILNNCGADYRENDYVNPWVVGGIIFVIMFYYGCTNSLMPEDTKRKNRKKELKK